MKFGWLWQAFLACVLGAVIGLVTPAQAFDVIDGSWMSPCVSSGGQNHKRDLYITGFHHYSTFNVYADVGCFNLVMRLEDYRTFDVRGNSSDVPGAVEVDTRAVRSHITVFDAGVADIWGAARFCGIPEWRVGIPTEITGRDCGGFAVPKAGDPDHDLYLRDSEGKLWVGQRTRSQDGSTPEKRPKAVDRSLSFRQL